MHVLTVTNYAPPYGGGIQFVVANLTRHLIAQGHSVTLLAADTGIPRGHSRWEGADRVGVPAANWLERLSVPMPLFNPLALARALAEAVPQADVIHLHGLLYLDCTMAAQMGRRQGKRVILTEHVGLVPYGSALLSAAQRAAVASLGRATVGACDAVAVLNNRVADEMRPLLRPGAPLVKVLNGVDGAVFRPPADRAAVRARLGLSRPTLLFAGRLAEKKGVPLLLQAAPLMPECDLVLCGQDMERLAGEALAPNVRIFGKRDQVALAEWYGAADALVLPSTGEGFPLVVQEALACGTPVIVGDEPTNREYLDERVAVFVERTPQAIAQAAAQLLASPAQLAAMRPAALAWARQNGGWDTATAAYLALYRGDAPSAGQGEIVG